jgi:HK97 gp10 family phage protein
MASEIVARLTGLTELRQALVGLPAKLRRGALRAALQAGARVIRDEARRRAPVLKASTFYGASALKRNVRAVGTLKKAISVRLSKLSTRRGDVGVFVNVRPLKNGNAKIAGAKNPNDPFYWRWQEFGWNPASGATGGAKGAKGKRTRRLLARRGAAKAKPGASFLRNAVTGKQGEAVRTIERTLGPAIQKLNTKRGAA